MMMCNKRACQNTPISTQTHKTMQGMDIELVENVAIKKQELKQGGIMKS